MQAGTNQGLDRLLRFESAQQFQNRELWRDDVDTRAHKPLKILGGYSFPKAQYLKCGMHSCRTVHGTGFLVLIEGGIETHIGQHCGKTHLGVAWEAMHRDFVKLERAQLLQDRILTLFSRKDATLKRAKQSLMAVDATDLRVNAIISELLKDQALTKVIEDAARNGGRLVHYRKMTEDERALAGGRAGRDQTIPVPIGTINGIGAWSAHSPAKSLKYDVIAPLHELSADSVSTLKPDALDQKAKWVSEMDATLRRADDHIKQAERFLRRANWVAFERMCLDSGIRCTDRGFRVIRRLAAGL